MSLAELIEFFCNQRKTGRLKIDYPRGHSVFFIREGELVDARVGGLSGVEAVYFSLTLPNAAFDFSPDVQATRRTINDPWTQVVLEGLRRLDEGTRLPKRTPSAMVALDADFATMFNRDNLNAAESRISEDNEASSTNVLDEVGSATAAGAKRVDCHGGPRALLAFAAQRPLMSRSSQPKPPQRATVAAAPAATEANR